MYQIIGPHNHYTLSTVDVNLLIALALWEIVWKGLALWRAARRNEPYWFAGLLVINTIGILPIVYLLATRPAQPKS